MPPALRPYQRKLKADTYAFWNSRTDPSNVMAVAATGSGKTVLFSDILAEYQGVRGALVHRQELVGQISLTLGKYGVRHRVIGAEKTVRDIISQHITELGTNYVDQNAKCFAASVDTLNGEPDAPWMQQTGLIVTDESHHVLKTNKWGKAMARFSRAYGFMPTATPGRPDGLGLGRHADGLADVLLAAPEMRDIINMG
jgi:superfamily II DNA or RNA helicase